MPARDTRAVETQAELAELAKLTPARVTQIMNLLGLAPDIQEEPIELIGQLYASEAASKAVGERPGGKPSGCRPWPWLRWRLDQDHDRRSLRTELKKKNRGIVVATCCLGCIEQGGAALAKALCVGTEDL